jgi:hypothetical protein
VTDTVSLGGQRERCLMAIKFAHPGSTTVICMNGFLVPLSIAALLVGCSGMLPRGSSDTPTPFAVYAQAEAAARKIEPFRTTTMQLPGLGFDPAAGSNVTMIPYPEIVARLAPYSGVPLDQLDEGVRACIQARSQCRGYLFRFSQEHRKREGPFMPDFFNLRRTTHVTGWWFQALVVVSGETVLFRNMAGEAHVDRVDKQNNPLGPLQSAGEAAGSLLLR